MTKLTNQQVFDLAATHLLTQNERSVDYDPQDDRGSGKCMYRGVGGLKCAIGALIPDELYTPQIENTPVDVLINRSPKVKELFAGIHRMLLCALQRCHDNLSPPQWHDELHRIARRFSLSPTALIGIPTTVK